MVVVEMTSKSPSYRFSEGGTFSFIIMLSDPYMVANFITDLKIVLSPYENTSFNGNSVFKLLGFPNNLFDRLENLMQKKYT